MSKCDVDVFKRVAELTWSIDSFEVLTDKKDCREGIYQKGDTFNFISRTPQTFNQALLKKAKDEQSLKVPFFMCIEPTWFIRDGVLFMVFIVGKDPCELHRFVIWFEGLETDQPEFKFTVTPLYDDCTCCESPTVLFSSPHGAGGGSGGGESR